MTLWMVQEWNVIWILFLVFLSLSGHAPAKAVRNSGNIVFLDMRNYRKRFAYGVYFLCFAEFPEHVFTILTVLCTSQIYQTLKVNGNRHIHPLNIGESRFTEAEYEPKAAAPPSPSHTHTWRHITLLPQSILPQL